jgi:hypothetical protein
MPMRQNSAMMAGVRVFANVFNTDKSSYLNSYVVFPAPNNGSGFSIIVAGKGGPAQGAQQLNVFNDSCSCYSFS